MRLEFPVINNIVNQLLATPSQSSWLLLPLFFFALAAGVVVSGITSVIFPFFLNLLNLPHAIWEKLRPRPYAWLVRVVFTDAEAQTVSLREINLQHVFQLPPENLKAVTNYAQTYQAYANMSVALFFSIAFLLYHAVRGVEHWHTVIPRLIIVSLMLAFLGLASLRAIRVIYNTYKKLS